MKFAGVLLVTLAHAFSQTALLPKLVYATYLGTGRNSVFQALSVDSAGFMYVAGAGPGSAEGSTCTFLTKLNQSGTAPVWTVCLPLAQVDGLAVDAATNIYVVGLNPPSISRISTVIKLAPDAQQLIYSTPIGGSSGKIALDQSGSVYVLGLTDSTFQTTPGAFSTLPSRGFVEKLDPSGAVEYATYIDVDFIGGIAVDSFRATWIVGGKKCGPFDCEGGLAVAIRKLDAAGASLLVSRTFGGGFKAGAQPQPVADSANAVAVDANDCAWIVGGDRSGSVPTTPNALESRRPNAAVAGYALKLASSGELLYGTYVGGFSQDPINSAALDGSGSPYFASVTSIISSTIMALAPDGSSALFSKSFASGVGSIALDGNGGLYMAGTPTVARVCPTTPGVYQPTTGAGNSIICAARLDLNQITPSELFYPLNAASIQPSSVAPGELVTLSGMNLPPDPSVTFDGLPAPIVSVDANKLTVVVPFGINTSWTSLNVDGVGGYTLGVWPSAPGLYTADGSGAGQLDARNQDGTVNSTDNPAAAGSTVTIFMTGAGAMVPALADGQLGPTDQPFPVPVQAIYASINGLPAIVVLAAQAPGQIAGIVRLDIQIPVDTRSGDAVVKVGVGNSDVASFPFQPRTTIAIQ